MKYCLNFFTDRRILFRTDYLLLLTFFCFFVFPGQLIENRFRFVKRACGFL